MDSVASIKPKNVEPVSPMKMLAGFKLNGIKPTQAPASTASKIAIGTSPISSDTASMVMQAIAETPTARPSKPSMRLTALVMATIQIIVIGMASAPNYTYSSPLNRFGISSMRKVPNTTGIAAAIS